MLGAMPDNRRISVIAIIALLVFSGLVLSSSASGVSPVYTKSYRMPLPNLITSSSSVAVANPSKIVEPISSGQLVIAGSGRSVQVRGFELGQSLSVSMVAPATGESEGPAPPFVGYAVATGSLIGASGAQAEGQVMLPSPGGATISTSGQGALVFVSPEGQVVVIATGAIGSAQFVQSNQVYFRTYIGMNEFGNSAQPSYSGLSTVTAAIPGLWLDSSKRRTRSQIYIEILELMKRGPMTPFEIAFYARLNHKRTKEYTEFLKRSGYLENHEEDGKLIYALTKNGLGFLDRVKSLFEECQPRDEMPNMDYSGFTVR